MPQASPFILCAQSGRHGDKSHRARNASRSDAGGGSNPASRTPATPTPMARHSFKRRRLGEGGPATPKPWQRRSLLPPLEVFNSKLLETAHIVDVFLPSRGAFARNDVVER